MTMITPSYLGETIEYSSLHACRSTLEDPTRRFLLHVLPRGFHRIRHYGLFANANRADNIATARALLGADPPAANPQQQPDVTPDAPRVLRSPCPRCGARMIVIEVFARGCEPRWRPTPSTIDTS